MLAVCPFLSAQQADRPASVIVVIVPGADSDVAYQTVLRDVLMVTLTRNRMEPSAAGTPDKARAAARQKEADYLLLGTWRNTAETIELAIEAWQAHDAATALSYDRQFANAAAGFRRVLALLPKDEHARRYLAECEKMRKSPPGADWTGVDEMTEK